MNFGSLFSFVVLITTCLSYRIVPKVNPKGPTVVREAVSCLLSIANTFFTKCPGLIVITQSFNMTAPGEEIKKMFMEAVHLESKWTVMVVGSDTKDVSENVTKSGVDLSYLFADKADYYVVIVDSVKTFKQKILDLSALNSWNPRAKVVVLCSDKFGSVERLQSNSQTMLSYLWKHYILYGIVLLQDINVRTRFHVYSWNPYDPPNRCGNITDRVNNTAKVYDTCVNGRLIRNEQIFDEKLPHDMKGCSIQVFGMIIPPFINGPERKNRGIEYELLMTIADALNFNILVDTSKTNRGERNKVGEWSGIMKKLMNKEGDLAIGGIYPDNKIHEDFDASASYLQDSYTWVVPKALLKPRWLSSVSAFKVDTWMSAVGTYVICVLVWYILAHINNESKYQKSIVHCVINCYMMVIGTSVYSRPTTQSLRTFFIFFCIYAVVLLTAYQANLVNVLTRPMYEKQISNLEDVFKAGLVVVGREEPKGLIDDTDEETYKIINEIYVEIMDTEQALHDLIKNRNATLLTSRMYLNDISSQDFTFTDDFGEPNYYMLDNVLSFPMEIVACKGYPFMDYISVLINLVKANGLMSKWTRDYLIEIRRTSTIRKMMVENQDEDEDGNVKLSTGHLQLGYLILIVGYVAGTVAFFFEYLSKTNTWHNIKSKLIDKTRHIFLRR